MFATWAEFNSSGGYERRAVRGTYIVDVDGGLWATDARGSVVIPILPVSVAGARSGGGVVLIEWTGYLVTAAGSMPDIERIGEGEGPKFQILESRAGDVFVPVLENGTIPVATAAVSDWYYVAGYTGVGISFYKSGGGSLFTGYIDWAYSSGGTVVKLETTGAAAAAGELYVSTIRNPWVRFRLNNGSGFEQSGVYFMATLERRGV